MSKDKEIFHFVEFTFSIPARGKDIDELKEFAVRELMEDSYEIMKDIYRNPQHAEIGEQIHEAELQDYFWDLQEEE